MENIYVIVPNGDLYHSGVLGMKWGVRRYQNKDGSLTRAGKKRYAKLEAEKAKIDAKMNKLGPKPAKAKSIQEMSDDELRERINRLNLEKNYKDALKGAGYAERKERGKKFVNTFADKLTEGFAEKTAGSVADLGAQTLKSVGAKYLNDVLSKSFGEGIEKVHTNNKK